MQRHHDNAEASHEPKRQPDATRYRFAQLRSTQRSGVSTSGRHSNPTRGGTNKSIEGRLLARTNGFQHVFARSGGHEAVFDVFTFMQKARNNGQQPLVNPRLPGGGK